MMIDGRHRHLEHFDSFSRSKRDPNGSYVEMFKAIEDLCPKRLDLLKVHWSGQLKWQATPNTISYLERYHVLWLISQHEFTVFFPLPRDTPNDQPVFSAPTITLRAIPVRQPHNSRFPRSQHMV